MRKIISLFLFVSMLVAPFSSVYAFRDGLSVFSASISTYPITEAATMSSQINYDEIRIYKILVSNDDLTQAQTITFYENSDSTTTVSSSWSFDLPTATTAADPKPLDITFPIEASYWLADDLCIRKSTTGSNVKVTIWYK